MVYEIKALYVCGHWGRPQTWILAKSTNVADKVSTYVTVHKCSHYFGYVCGHVTNVAIVTYHIPIYWQQS